MAKTKPPRLWLARDKDFDKGYRFISGWHRLLRGSWWTATRYVAMCAIDFEVACPLRLKPGEIRELKPLEFKPEKRKAKR